jgi:hypothetical protein
MEESLEILRKHGRSENGEKEKLVASEISAVCFPAYTNS